MDSDVRKALRECISELQDLRDRCVSIAEQNYINSALCCLSCADFIDSRFKSNSKDS